MATAMATADRMQPVTLAFMTGLEPRPHFVVMLWSTVAHCSGLHNIFYMYDADTHVGVQSYPGMGSKREVEQANHKQLRKHRLGSRRRVGRKVP